MIKSAIRKNVPVLNKEKGKNLILYILNRLGPMSIERLTYFLYFMEFDYYEKYEEHLVGFTFKKTKNGIEIYG